MTFLFNFTTLPKFLGTPVLTKAMCFSTEKEKKINNSIIFEDNSYLCFIPPITSMYEDDLALYGNQNFPQALNYIFYELKDYKNFKYKFVFKLFIHTNDNYRYLDSVIGPTTYPNDENENKNLTFLISPNIYPKDILNSTNMFNQSELFKDTLAQSMLNNEYKYYGYGDICSLDIDFNENLNKMDFLKMCAINLGKSTGNVNNGLISDEFIDLKKWIILKIIRTPIPINNNNMKNSSFMNGNSRSYSTTQISFNKQLNIERNLNINTFDLYKKLNGNQIH
jgi:hypothetical protein